MAVSRRPPRQMRAAAAGLGDWRAIHCKAGASA